MAMVNQQVESFVQKFRELWASGLSAHLDLDCGGGEAWVGLRLRLGRHRVGGAQQIVMTVTEEVPAMPGVWRDARQRALQLHKPPVFPQAKLNKPA